MKFSYRWLADFVELPAPSREAAAALGVTLTKIGLAVEGLEAHGKDWVLDIDVTSNRPDCMNHRGIAREIAAARELPLKALDLALDEVDEKTADSIRVEIADFTRCPRYVARVVRGVKVGPSPDWLVERLEAIGSRAINNIVDITNYVMWEMGQPLHAFDLATINGGLVRVRDARVGETLKTLDKEERKLDPEILLIVDAGGPIALGGIMGGFDSEVTEKTLDVLIEAAHFQPLAVRRGAKKLGMLTDASRRFERGADPEGPIAATARAAALMAALGGGRVLRGAVDVVERQTVWQPSLEIERSRLDRFAGIAIPPATTDRIFAALGFAIEHRGAERLQVTAPTWRAYDFQDPYPADFYEEVLRIVGFDEIPATLPTISGADAPMLPSHRRRRQVQDYLAAAGFAEAINYAFHDRAADDAYPNLVGDRPALTLANPLSTSYEVMRRALLPNLVGAARYNQRRGLPAIRLFELGHVFWQPEDALNAELDAIALVIGGRLGTPWQRAIDVDFYDLKGVLDGLLEALGVPVTWRSAEIRRLQSGISAEILLDGQRVGFAGQLAEDEPGYPLFVAELLLGRLAERTLSLEVQAPSRFPGVPVDLTLTHSLSRPWQELEAAIVTAQVPDLVAFGLKDRYQGQGVPAGQVNTTIFFHYNAADRSLTQEEVNERHLALAADLKARFGA
jgi:phenylalanyl-tRNA synthetase beta chain